MNNSNFMVAFLMLSLGFFLGGMENSQDVDENYVMRVLEDYQKRCFLDSSSLLKFNKNATQQFVDLCNEYLDVPLDDSFKNRFYKLLQDGADIYGDITWDVIGITEERAPIHRAAEKGNLELVRILFDAGRNFQHCAPDFPTAQQASHGTLLRLLVKGGSLNLFSTRQECRRQILVFEQVLDRVLPQWDKDMFDNIKEIFTGKEAPDMRQSKEKIKKFILEKNIPRLVKNLTKEHEEPVDGECLQQKRTVVPALPQDMLKIIVGFVAATRMNYATVADTIHNKCLYLTKAYDA